MKNESYKGQTSKPRRMDEGRTEVETRPSIGRMVVWFLIASRKQARQPCSRHPFLGARLCPSRTGVY